MNVTKTDRGFELIEFADDNGAWCQIQQSSAVRVVEEGLRGEPRAPGSSLLWIGREHDRMHLDRQQVAELVRHLNAWLETGSLEAKPAQTDALALQALLVKE